MVEGDELCQLFRAKWRKPSLGAEERGIRGNGGADIR